MNSVLFLALKTQLTLWKPVVALHVEKVSKFILFQICRLVSKFVNIFHTSLHQKSVITLIFTEKLLKKLKILEGGIDFYDQDCEDCVLKTVGGACYDCFGQCFIEKNYPDPEVLVKL